jgi:hypothetical protein
MARAQSAHRLGSARVALASREPQDVCGAATVGCAALWQARQHTAPSADNGRTPRRKKAKKPLSGVVCLLTTGGLIRVRHWMCERPPHRLSTAL